MMTTVVLGGGLGQRFGRRVWRLDLTVPSPTEAVRALCANLPGLRAYFLEHSRPGYHVFVGKKDIGEKELSTPAGSVITIMPALVGGGEDDAAWFQIVLGSALVLGGVLAAVFIPGSAPFMQPVIGIGVSLALGGVSQLLFKPPADSDPLEDPSSLPNTTFDGPVNTVSIGNPVPVCYGELEVGSQVISASITKDAQAFGNDANAISSPDN